jgi:WD40 repeat protein
MLRHSGIDRDLAIIIDKALDSDPQRRYPNAATLAADLKAFKSGARIAARSYSLLAMLGHWTRRHRTLALSVASVVAFAIVGSIFYVRSVAEERDLADASKQSAKRAQAAAESTLGQFTLKHAELLLMTDPSAAIDVLATHPDGPDGKNGRADQIRAEAAGRGVALIRAKPHTDTVRWAVGRPDGSVISLSVDGTIVRTSLRQTSTVLTKGVSPRARFSYSPARGLLAYGCDPADVCLWDVFHGMRIALAPAFRDWQLAGLSFSPDGSKLALLSYSGLLRILEISAPEQPIQLLQLHRAQGVGILFVDNDTVAVGLQDSLAIELIRMNGETQTLTIHSNFVWEAIPNEHRIVLGTEHGDAIYVDNAPLRALNRVSICHGSVVGIKMLPGRHTIAYACREGAIGTWDLKSHSIIQLTHLEGHADALAVSEAGDYVIAVGGNRAVVVFDLLANIVTSYRGHEFRLTSVSAPTVDYPYFVSADQRGALRVWPIPNRIARVPANVDTSFASAIFTGTTDTTISTTTGAELIEFSPPNNIRTVSPHLASATSLESAANGNTFATYGSSESVELWSLQTLSRQRVITTGQGAVSRLAFIGKTDDFVTAGRDGRLIYWTANGEQRQTVKFDSPIVNLVSADSAQYLIVNTVDGALWRTDGSDHAAPLRSSGARVVKMMGIPNTESVGIAYENGELNVLDTHTWQQVSILHTGQAVRDVAFSRNGDTIAVADSDDIIHVGRRTGTSWAADKIIWTAFAARAGRLALAPDGLLVALCSDGAIWLYSSMYKAWICLPIGAAPRIVVVTTDGHFAAIFDTEGRIVWLDLELARKSFVDMATVH